MVVMMREVVEKDEAESLGLSGLQAHPIHFLSSHNTFISSLPSPSYKLPLSPPFRDWLPPSLSVGGRFFRLTRWTWVPREPKKTTQEKCVSTQFAFHSEFGRLLETCRRMLTR